MVLGNRLDYYADDAVLITLYERKVLASIQVLLSSLIIVGEIWISSVLKFCRDSSNLSELLEAKNTICSNVAVGADEITVFASLASCEDSEAIADTSSCITQGTSLELLVQGTALLLHGELSHMTLFDFVLREPCSTAVLSMLTMMSIHSRTDCADARAANYSLPIKVVQSTLKISRHGYCS